VRKILSSRRVVGVPHLCNDQGHQRARNMGKGEYCSDFGEGVCQFITGKSSVTEDPMEA